MYVGNSGITTHFATPVKIARTTFTTWAATTLQRLTLKTIKHKSSNTKVLFFIFNSHALNIFMKIRDFKVKKDSQHANNFFLKNE
jgi:hypothetical protein